MSGVGTPIIAPEGWRELTIGNTYYYAGRSSDGEFSLICLFSPTGHGVSLYRVRSSDFETALMSGLLRPETEGNGIPPWLAVPGADGSLTQLPTPTAAAARRAEDRLKKIRPLLDHSIEVLSARKPLSAINRFARSSTPQINRCHAPVWFFSCIIFGAAPQALLPRFFACGGGEHQNHCGRKLGRPSQEGRHSGYPSTPEMRAKIVASYLIRRKKQRPIVEAYYDSIRHDFGCVESTAAAGKKTLHHPDGDPFPSYEQYRYAIQLHYSQADIHRYHYGEERYRQRRSPSRGKYTEQLSSLMQAVEADGYYVADVPRGFTDAFEMPPVCVVRLSDVLSSMGLGVGFSFGSETSRAYRQAFFCAAVGPAFFARKFFGLQISDSDWPCKGIPLSATTDRGPGAGALDGRDRRRFPTAAELTASYDPQGKATVEGGNPKTIRMIGKPEHFASDLTYFEIIQREILREHRRNNTADISKKYSPTTANVAPVPAACWDYYDGRWRNDAVQIDFASAVRAYLDRFEFSVKEDGVYRHGVRYDAEELRDTGLLHRYMREGAITVMGYALGVSMRYAWIEYQGVLIEVEIRPPSQAHDREMNLSEVDLQTAYAKHLSLQRGLRENKAAVDIAVKNMYQQSTGKDWYAGRRRTGAKKAKTRKATAELSILKSVTTP
ncbi:MAG: hypothetical protein KDG50_03330 [Chromatiales bacterium]|nr:hypothetical protein [Chromatiales bacterium]